MKYMKTSVAEACQHASLLGVVLETTLIKIPEPLTRTIPFMQNTIKKDEYQWKSVCDVIQPRRNQLSNPFRHHKFRVDGIQSPEQRTSDLQTSQTCK